MIKKKFIIKNEVGLHARPAAVFVQTASKYKSEITIEKNGKIANAKSIVEVLSLGVERGEKITISINGEDEETAMKTIETLINKNFESE